MRSKLHSAEPATAIGPNGGAVAPTGTAPRAMLPSASVTVARNRPSSIFYQICGRVVTAATPPVRSARVADGGLCAIRAFHVSL